MMSRLLGACGVLSLLCLSVACDVKVGENGVSLDVAHGKASDEWKRSYHLPPGGRVEIVNVSGLVTLAPSAGADVEVAASREASAPTEENARELLQKAEMVEQVSPDRVSIESRLDRRNGIGRKVIVQITVRVPPGLRVSLKTEDGGIRFDGVDGAITAESVNGPIIGRGVTGPLTASTVNGGVRIEIAKVSADSRITTVNGPVELALAPDVNANLEATVVNGVVLVADGVPMTETERTPQRVAGKVNNGGPRIVAQTTNGAVRVKSGKLDIFEGLRGRGRRGAPRWSTKTKPPGTTDSSGGHPYSAR